jgi:acyl-CoA thioester hydrolase
MMHCVTPFRVRYAETDQMGRAHHSNYIVWMEMARIDLLRKYGLDYDRLEAEGYLLPVAGVNVEYHKPAFFDEGLEIHSSITEKPKAKIPIEYKIYNKKRELVASASSLHVFMQPDGKAIRPPLFFREQMDQIYAVEKKNAG